MELTENLVPLDEIRGNKDIATIYVIVLIHENFEQKAIGVYCGQTISSYIRWFVHRSRLENKDDLANTSLLVDYNYFGKERFFAKAIEQYIKKDYRKDELKDILDEREEYWTNIFKNDPKILKVYDREAVPSEYHECMKCGEWIRKPENFGKKNWDEGFIFAKTTYKKPHQFMLDLDESHIKFCKLHGEEFLNDILNKISE